jgi:integrase
MARKLGSKWVGDAVVNGVRQRKRFDTMDEAEAFERGDLRKGSVDRVFRDGFDLFWKGTRNERNAHRHTEFLIGYFGKDRHVSSFTTADVQALIRDLRDEHKNTSATINRKLAALSKLLTFAQDQGFLQKVPKIGFLKERQGRIRFLSKEEEAKILDALPDHYRAYATFLLYTGCRVSEALNLHWQDVQGQRVTFWETKNDRSRSVPLTPRAQAALQWTKGQGWIRPFAKVHYDAFHEAWKKAKDKAGLKGDTQIVPHILRHTCASRLVQNGVDIYRVKEWLGHSSIQVTMRYAHLRLSDLDGAALALEA